MFRRVALVITDISEELSPSIIRMTTIGELGTTLAVTGNRRILRNTKLRVRRVLVVVNDVPNSPSLVTLTIDTRRSSETSVLTRATLRNISRDSDPLESLVTGGKPSRSPAII
jgi:hypothetical protein